MKKPSRGVLVEDSLRLIGGFNARGRFRQREDDPGKKQSVGEVADCLHLDPGIRSGECLDHQGPVDDEDDQGNTPADTGSDLSRLPAEQQAPPYNEKCCAHGVHPEQTPGHILRDEIDDELRAEKMKCTEDCQGEGEAQITQSRDLV